MSDSPRARPISDDGDLRAIADRGQGFVIDPFNRWWHRASCERLARMTTGERKWFAETEAAATEYFAARAASYPTSKPIRPCRSCGPGGELASLTLLHSTSRG